MDFNIEFNDGTFTLTSKGGENQYFKKFFETNLINEVVIVKHSRQNLNLFSTNS